MKILLITTTPVMQGCESLKLRCSYYGGGWVEGLVELLPKYHKLNVLFLYPGIEEIKTTTEGNTTFIAVPMSGKTFETLGSDPMLSNYLEEVEKQIKPDIVQMFGTETPVTKIVLSIFGAERTVIHLTGLVGPYSIHFMGGLNEKEIRNQTFRDILKGGLKQDKKIFKRNAVPEREALTICKYVLGRTEWDKACVEHVNPNIHYYRCNEMLRDSFYGSKWCFERCDKQRIFVSTASTPLKGFHQVLDALPLILKKFPNTELIVSGRNITKDSSLRDHLKMTSYGKVLLKKIRQNNIEKHIHFVGSLDSNEMVTQYLKANVFILPSNIENSPNSLGEAMILGVPCVAAYVGGVPDMLADKKEGFLYPYDEPYMLAYYVCKIFEDEELAKQFSENARSHALQTHNREKIADNLISIYKEIVGDNEKNTVHDE